MARDSKGRFFDFLDDCGRSRGARVIRCDSGQVSYTASCWSYEIQADNKSLVWSNSHVEQGVPIAVILRVRAVAPGTGGYVQGVDYINPALRPIFDSIVKRLESARGSSVPSRSGWGHSSIQQRPVHGNGGSGLPQLGVKAREGLAFRGVEGINQVSAAARTSISRRPRPVSP